MNSGVAISVIIPVYNAAKYLNRTIRCLLDQEFPCFEVIFVDDLSDDGSSEMLKSRTADDTRFRYYRNDRNVGCGESRNIGVRCATGRFAVFLDADDVYDKRLLSEMYHAITKYDADVAVCNSRVIDARDGSQKTFGQWKRLEEKMTGKYWCLEAPSKQEGICDLIDYVAWNKMFRLDYFKSNGIAFPNLKYYEDIPFSFLLCLRASKLVFVNEKLIDYYKNHEGSMTSWTISKEFYIQNAFDCIIARKDELPWKDIGSALINRALKNIISFIMSDEVQAGERQKLLEDLCGIYYDKWDVQYYLDHEMLIPYVTDFFTRLKENPDGAMPASNRRAVQPISTL